MAAPNSCSVSASQGLRRWKVAGDTHRPAGVRDEVVWPGSAWGVPTVETLPGFAPLLLAAFH